MFRLLRRRCGVRAAHLEVARDVRIPASAPPIIEIPERTSEIWLLADEAEPPDARVTVFVPGMDGDLSVWLDDPTQWDEDLARVALASLLEAVQEGGHEVRYRGMFAAAREAIGVSRNGVHIEVNEPYVRLFGYDHADELIGHSTLDLLVPEEHDRIRGYVRDRQAGRPAPVHYEARARKKDGTEFDVAVRVFADTKGPITDVIGIMEDITEQNRQASALRELQELYRAVFEVNSAMKLCIDPAEGAIVNANEAACRFYGYSHEALTRMRISDINVLGDATLPHLSRAAVEQATTWQFRHRLASGEIRDVEVHSSPIQVEGHTLVLSIIFDVTERQRLEARLREAQKMETIGRLAGGIAHDFNNLLTVILGNCDSLRESDDTQTRTMATQAYNAGRRAADLTRQLLAYARRQLLLPKDEDFADVLHGMTPLLRRAIAEHIRVRVETEGTLPVFVDRSQVEYAVLYVVSHAAERLPRGGEITVLARLDGDDVMLVVEDDGGLLDDAEIQALFEPFGASRSGLGLGTVRGTVAQSGGTVDAVRGQRGLQVRIRFPARAPAPVAAPPADRPAVDPPTRGTILVVEDQDEVRAFLVYRLRRDGYDVLEAAGAADALAAAEDRHLDLLVSDVVMPGMSGLECHQKLAERQPALRALFVTGHSEEIVSDQGRLPEGASILQKPFTGPTLSKAVRAALAR